jgi:hypothetical protein
MLHLALLAVRLHQLVTLAVFEIALSYETHCLTIAATSASLTPPRPRRSEQKKSPDMSRAAKVVVRYASALTQRRPSWFPFRLRPRFSRCVQEAQPARSAPGTAVRNQRFLRATY